jgi:hypothetical protein
MTFKQVGKRNEKEEIIIRGMEIKKGERNEDEKKKNEKKKSCEKERKKKN